LKETSGKVTSGAVPPSPTAERPAPEPPVDLTVIVVSYETRDLTLACLESLEVARGGLDVQVIVVDNASSDGSAQALQGLDGDYERMMLPENVGFARANNLAAERARGRYLLLLNPDTVVRPDTLEALLRFADAHPEAGIVGGRTTFADGSLNPSSCWRRPSPWSLACLGTGLTSLLRRNPLFDPESMGRWARDTVRRVDVVSGCLLLIRRPLWEELEGFDEDFFMYAEDADLCLRAADAGHPCMITPEAEIVHLGGASERVRADKMVSLFRARVRLYRKHWSRPTAAFGVRMHDLWAFTRMSALGLLARLQPRRRASFEAWRAIWRRRGEWHAEG
jgi:GT2 family glycosyltransferase